MTKSSDQVVCGGGGEILREAGAPPNRSGPGT